MAKTKLFPNFLGEGSSGLAVNVLAIALQAAECDPGHEIALDRQYTPGGAISRAVARLQRRYEHLTPTGHLDRKTLEALEEESGLPLSTYTEEMFAPGTVVVTAEQLAEG